MPTSSWRQICAVMDHVEEAYLAALEAGEPFRVLDVGCGRGRYGVLIRESWRDAEIFGLDARPERCAWEAAYDRVAGGVVPRAQLFAGTRFSIVLCLDVIEHLPKASGWALIRWCRSRGPTVLSTPDGFMEQGGPPYDRHLSGWSVEELDEVSERLEVVPPHPSTGGTGQIVALLEIT